MEIINSKPSKPDKIRMRVTLDMDRSEYDNLKEKINEINNKKRELFNEAISKIENYDKYEECKKHRILEHLKVLTIVYNDAYSVTYYGICNLILDELIDKKFDYKKKHILDGLISTLNMIREELDE